MIARHESQISCPTFADRFFGLDNPLRCADYLANGSLYWRASEFGRPRLEIDDYLANEQSAETSFPTIWVKSASKNENHLNI